jgi:hypothetical protein
MTRAIGPNQRRILDILLLERGEPMTPDGILGALGPLERVAWGNRQPNLSQALAGLVRRGLVRREGGDWLTVDGTRRRRPVRVAAVQLPGAAPVPSDQQFRSGRSGDPRP